MPPKLDKHLVRLMAICDHVLDIQQVCINQHATVLPKNNSKLQ